MLLMPRDYLSSSSEPLFASPPGSTPTSAMYGTSCCGCERKAVLQAALPTHQLADCLVLSTFACVLLCTALYCSVLLCTAYLQERLKAVCVEVAESPRKIILFIDDIHNLVPNAAQQVGL
jgi:hypothetical protein